MLQYLVILLDDTAVSYCHYENECTQQRLMPLDTLRQAILYGMKENLNIQFVMPSYPLTDEYEETINSVEHVRIAPASFANDAKVVVSDSLENLQPIKDVAYVLRTDKKGLFEQADKIATLIESVTRLNVVITDVETFTESDFARYEEVLKALSDAVEKQYVSGNPVQLNLLTDRMMLKDMNNCGAGDTTLTVAPDGKFYVCPAFYHAEDGYAVGSLDNGLDIKNPQLYRLDHAPICRHCDAWHCKRCVWLNRKTTLEVNTPSHEQCVVAHIEREASRQLLNNIRKHGAFLPESDEIPVLTYTDPFENKDNWDK